MFGRDDNPAPPPQREMTKQELFESMIPALRTFKVLRVKATERTVDDTPVFETIYVQSHALAIGDDDRTVFQQWRLNPFTGPALEVVRLLTGVLEVEEMPVQLYDGNRLV